MRNIFVNMLLKLIILYLCSINILIALINLGAVVKIDEDYDLIFLYNFDWLSFIYLWKRMKINEKARKLPCLSFSNINFALLR